jgi:hypothetical protein
MVSISKPFARESRKSAPWPAKPQAADLPNVLHRLFVRDALETAQTLPTRAVRASPLPTFFIFDREPI